MTLPNTTLQSSNIILGSLRITELDTEGIRALVTAARDLGINTFDHADIYGSEPHDCERLFGDAVTFTPAERAQVIIQSKVGIRKGFFDSSSEHIQASVDRSLAALKTDYLDTLLIHRPDTLVEPDEVAAAFDALHNSGKVRNFGVSNHTPGQIELLKQSLNQPLVINQMQLSIAHAPLITAGLSANIADLDQSIDRDNGILDYCRLNHITLQAWSPLQNAAADGIFLDDRKNYAELNDLFDELATTYDVAPAAIAVAWITRHPANIQVVAGTTNPQHLRDSADGSDIPLTRPEWYRLFSAAKHRLP